MPQLISAATTHGLWLSSLRCAYQANVMNTLLRVSSTMVLITGEDSAEAIMFMDCRVECPFRALPGSPFPVRTRLGDRARQSAEPSRVLHRTSAASCWA